MSDQVQFGYTPNLWQEQYHRSSDRHCCLSGGVGTLPAGSLIETRDGAVPIENLTSPRSLVSLSHNGIALAEGTQSFPVGLKRQCRIVHEFGELLCSDTHRLFCVSGEYVRACDLSVGESLVFLPSSLNPLSTTSGIFQTRFQIDDPHLMKIISGFLGGCLVYVHQHGLLPHDLAMVCQSLAPSLIYEECNAQTVYQDGQNHAELELLHNRLGQLLHHLENHCSSAPAESRKQDVLNHCASERVVRILQDNQFFGQAQSSYDYHLKALLLSSPNYGIGPCLLPSAVDYRPSKILSIEMQDEVPMYDLHVVGTNNYVSQGLIHSNSGKTLAAVMEHLTIALEYPHSRWVVGRKTLPSLRDTILKSFLAAVPQELVREFNKAQLNLTLINGSEFLFRPLDDPEKLKSLEVAGFIIEEANEVEEEIWQRLKDRMRQKLPNGTRPRYRSTIMLNPGDEDHWIPQVFLFRRPDGHKLFQSSTIDNMLNLPSEYIDELKSTYNEATLQRLLYGQFGRIHKGRPVFPTFNRKDHVRLFDYDPKIMLVRGWDFGFNHPVCTWLQMRGDQIRVLNVLKGKRIYLDDFINGTQQFDGVRKAQEALFGPNIPTKDFCDPRGSDETDKGVTSVSILNRNGIFPIYRRTWIEEGLDAMKMKMDTKDRLTGEPNLIVHPRCKNLIEGLLGGYHRDEDDTPVKDNLYDNDVDGIRYPILHMVQTAAINRQMARQDFNRAYVNPRTARRIEY